MKIRKGRKKTKWSKKREEENMTFEIKTTVKK